MHPEAVLVTGASTGIGKAITEDLRSREIRVFAAVRDLSSVEPHPFVTPVRLDVTSSDEIKAAAELVAGNLRDSKLRGIVNNAGVALGGPLEFISLDRVREHFDVNFFAQLEVTQAFLPILRGQGIADPRIVFMGSISSPVSAPMLGPYSAGKHALKAAGEALRGELLEWGMHVSVIEPGNIATPIWGKGKDMVSDLLAELPDEARDLYEPVMHRMSRLLTHADQRAIPASKVAKAVRKSLFAKRLKAEYLVGPDAHIMAAGKSFVPTRIYERLMYRELERRGLE